MLSVQIEEEFPLEKGGLLYKIVKRVAPSSNMSAAKESQGVFFRTSGAAYMLVPIIPRDIF